MWKLLPYQICIDLIFIIIKHVYLQYNYGKHDDDCMHGHGPWKAPDKINNKAPAADSLYPIITPNFAVRRDLHVSAITVSELCISQV